jgi:hypothetical protein
MSTYLAAARTPVTASTSATALKFVHRAFGLWMHFTLPLCAVGALGEQPLVAQCQDAKFVPVDTHYDQHFGCSVGISGEWAIAGARADNAVANLSGAVYVHHRQAGTWNQVQKLKASDAEPSTGFGSRVAIDGDWFVATSPGARVGGIQGAGAAYLFERSGTTWIERARINASDPAASAQFGLSPTAISGNRVLVGTYQDRHAGVASGAAYLFEHVGTNWVQVQKIVPNDGASGQFFSNSTSIEGDRCVIGAFSDSSGGLNNNGAAYVFERRGTQWLQAAKLVASDAADEDGFGVGVVLSGNTIFVGSGCTTSQGDTGAVYVFQLEQGQWIERQKFVGHDSVTFDNFGSRLSVSGDRLLVSGAGDSDLGSSSGSAYVFERLGGVWTQTSKFFPVDGSPNDAFGLGAISGTSVVVGVENDDEACPTNPACSSGSVYFYSLPSGTTQYGSCASSSPCSNADDFGGCKNSTGHGAVLSSCGTSSVALDDLVLRAEYLPPSVFGLVFMGGSEASVPLGDGLRVVAPGAVGLQRFAALPVSASGSASLGPGIVATSQSFAGQGAIQPGQSRRFQLWYRDGQGPCGSGTNVSNGVRVDFVP